MSILIAGFEPFGKEAVNPAILSIDKLDDKIGNYKLHKLQIPVVFHESWQVLHQEIEKVNPKYVIVVGQAGGRSGITIERVAINVDDSEGFADNKGNTPKDAPIVKNGPHGYFTNLPFRNIIDSIKQGGIPASLSNDAGTFVCNHIFYQLMNYINDGHDIAGGFIHVPYCTEQVLDKPSQASLTLDQITKALQLALETLE